MGLDAVELVMAFEEGFGVSISDAEAEASVTPAMIIDVIYAKLRSSDSRICPSQQAFYLLRKAAIKNLGIPRKAVTLDVDIRSLVRDKSQETIWNSLKTELQARSWPVLERPVWTTGTLVLFTICILLSAFYHHHWIIGTACALLFAAVGERATRGNKSNIPSRYSTFRKLVPSAMTSDFISWTREQVAMLVKKITVTQLGLKDGQYREDAHFIKDLHID